MRASKEGRENTTGCGTESNAPYVQGMCARRRRPGAMIRPPDAVISRSDLRRLDLDLVSANAELGGDRAAGCLGDFVGSGAIEFEPRQSRYLALLEHDFESWMSSPLDLASMLVEHFRAALAHLDLSSDGPCQGRRARSFNGPAFGRSPTACPPPPPARDRWKRRGALTTGDNPRRPDGRWHQT